MKRYSGLIVKFGDKVLLCKRNLMGDRPGRWSIPAGKIEKNESALSAVIREFYEETNITITEEPIFVGMIKTDSQKSGIMYVFLHISDKKLSPDLKNAKDGDEHTECGYFNFNEMITNDLGSEMTEIMKKVFQKY